MLWEVLFSIVWRSGEAVYSGDVSDCNGFVKFTLVAVSTDGHGANLFVYLALVQWLRQSVCTSGVAPLISTGGVS